MSDTFTESFPEIPNLQLLTPSQVAKVLATSDQNVYNMINRGEIPVVQFGKIKRIRYMDLVKYIEKHLEGQE